MEWINILSWLATGLAVLAFWLVNTKKFEKTFFPINVIASLMFMVYEINISAWSLFTLHSYIAIMSAIKCYQIFK